MRRNICAHKNHAHIPKKCPDLYKNSSQKHILQTAKFKARNSSFIHRI